MIINYPNEVETENLFVYGQYPSDSLVELKVFGNGVPDIGSRTLRHELGGIGGMVPVIYPAVVGFHKSTEVPGLERAPESDIVGLCRFKFGDYVVEKGENPLGRGLHI